MRDLLKVLMRKKKNWLIPISLALTFFLGYAPQATSQSVCVSNAENVSSPKRDSSVELELKLTPKLMSLFTTLDGSVAPLLNGAPFSDVTKDILGKWANTPPSQILWDSLTFEQKVAVMREAAFRKPTAFSEDRIFPGLKVREKITLNFKKTTKFLNEVYEPGEHLVPVGQYLGKIEFQSARQDHTYLELHFRAKGLSGTVFRSAWALCDGLGIPRSHLHIHIVSEVPFNIIKENVFLAPVTIAESYRRANLQAEMLLVVNDGQDVKQVQHLRTREVIFDHLRKESLKGIVEKLQAVGQGQPFDIGADFKMAFVGLHGSDKYDEPGLLGYEVRTILGFSDEDTFEQYLNQLQMSMIPENLRSNEALMSRWLETFYPGVAAAEAIQNAWYDKDWDTLFSELPEPMRSHWASPEAAQQKSWMEGIDDLQLKMVFYDWSKDPLVFENTVLKSRIVQAQQVALIKLLSKNLPFVSFVVKDFLVDSGLYQLLTDSLRSPDHPFVPPWR